MTTYDVRELDPHDAAALRRWWEIGRLATAERPHNRWSTLERTRAVLTRPDPHRDVRVLGAFEGDRMVGAGRVCLFLVDNTHAVEHTVLVPPAERRRGVGRALVAAHETIARDAGRTTLFATVSAPLDAENPGTRFATALGYAVASAEERKLVVLADQVASWGRLDAEVGRHLGGYRTETFRGRVPDRHVEGFCRLLEGFMSSIPLGDLDLQDGSWTSQRLREAEDRAAALGETWIVALAFDPAGDAVGFSDLTVASPTDTHAEVGGTLVLEAHRGHRLGLALKLATHRAVLDLAPGLEWVETGNAGVNAPMNGVNAAMGYRVVERCLDVQKRL